MHRLHCCTSALCQLIGTGMFETLYICFLMSNMFQGKVFVSQCWEQFACG